MDLMVKPKGHKVPKTCPSWTHIKGASTDEILRAASWASTTVSASYRCPETS